jgi:hypothetical protein
MNGRTCLVGYSGFVGSNLLKQAGFDDLYRSTNIHEIRGHGYGLLVCAGVPAVKWHANKFPEEDRANIDRLLDHLSTVQATKFVLISTVDVYPVTVGVNESFDCTSVPNHPYGTHRLYLEQKLTSMFRELHILRLPGLFGAGLKKNVIYDLLHDNCLPAIHPDSVFQYYDLSCLWADMGTVIGQNLPLVNLVTEPLATRTMIERFFPAKQVGAEAEKPGRYEISTRYATAFGKNGDYRFNAEEVLSQLARYIQTVRDPSAA